MIEAEDRLKAETILKSYQRVFHIVTCYYTNNLFIIIISKAFLSIPLY